MDQRLEQTLNKTTSHWSRASLCTRKCTSQNIKLWLFIVFRACGVFLAARLPAPSEVNYATGVKDTPCLESRRAPPAAAVSRAWGGIRSVGWREDTAGVWVRAGKTCAREQLRGRHSFRGLLISPHSFQNRIGRKKNCFKTKSNEAKTRFTQTESAEP